MKNLITRIRDAFTSRKKPAPLTRPFSETVAQRLAEDPEFADAMEQETNFKAGLSKLPEGYRAELLPGEVKMPREVFDALYQERRRELFNKALAGDISAHIEYLNDYQSRHWRKPEG